MPESVELRERLTRLEADVDNLVEKVEAMAAHVTATHDLLMQAKGARWAVVGIATVGGFLAAKFSFLGAWLVGR